MAWERRQRGVWYYTRSKRRHGRVVREYYGSGEWAQLLAALDAERQDERAAQRETRKAERAEPRALDEALAAFGSALDDAVCATLEAAGYHAHRGSWRRKRTAAAGSDVHDHG